MKKLRCQSLQLSFSVRDIIIQVYVEYCRERCKNKNLNLECIYRVLAYILSPISSVLGSLQKQDIEECTEAYNAACTYTSGGSPARCNEEEQADVLKIIEEERLRHKEEQAALRKAADEDIHRQERRGTSCDIQGQGGRQTSSRRGARCSTQGRGRKQTSSRRGASCFPET